jgi:phosphate transport system substrate-binding protein
MKSVIFGATVLMVVLASAAEARNHLRIVSSPGDFVYTSKVAESFSREYRQPAPVIRRTGSRTTIRVFCAGIGVDHPDIVSPPRPMQQAEFDECQGNGVKRITQIKVGYEAVVRNFKRRLPSDSPALALDEVGEGVLGLGAG